ncbi:hypothetical protein J4474_02215 [Candidatus Pacearchaeota archaeon]|nr:hypothetical protein [Candidatus Pacearchaeota archaeon]
MNFIKKIVEKKIDVDVHFQFQKFSRGEFRDKAGISAKKTGNKYAISTSAEFGNDLVKLVAGKVGKNKVEVTGIIVTTSDLDKEGLVYSGKSQFQGIKKYEINGQMSGDEILGLINKFPKVFFALSFSTPDGETTLKIKPKMPKTGKPKGGAKEGEEEKKQDFCKIVTTDSKIGESFIFEVKDFKEASVNHTFFVEDIIVPVSLKNEKDFAKVREGALRKGKILRVAKIDGKEFRNEIGFEA